MSTKEVIQKVCQRDTIFRERIQKLVLTTPISISELECIYKENLNLDT